MAHPRACALALTTVLVACSSSSTNHPGDGGQGGGSASGGAEQAGAGGQATGGGSPGAGGSGQQSTGGVAQQSAGGRGGERATGGEHSASGGAGGLGDGGNTAGACSFSSAPSKPVQADAGASDQAQQEASWLEQLDYLVGQYLRGDILVYRGTVKASDNTSAIYAASGQEPPQPDEVMAQEAALARLEYRASSASDYAPPLKTPASDSAILVVHGLTDKKHVVFAQAKDDPSLTDATMIGESGAFIRLETSCMACAATFWGGPATIKFDLTANGTLSVFQGIVSQGGHDVDIPIKVSASTSLSIVPPCKIQYDDLALLNTNTGPNEGGGLALDSFKRVGDEMVYHASGAINGGTTTGRCFLQTQYTIDLFIDAKDLSHYGVRSFSAGMQHETCAP